MVTMMMRWKDPTPGKGCFAVHGKPAACVRRVSPPSLTGVSEWHTVQGALPLYWRN